MTRKIDSDLGSMLLEVLRLAYPNQKFGTEVASEKGIQLDVLNSTLWPGKGWRRKTFKKISLVKNNRLQRSLRVGKRWVILPGSFKKMDPDCIPILLEPGMGFGSGSHETTQLCLELLEKIPVGKSFLDLGTGSGILAIAAQKRGFSQIVGLEIDPQALRSARKNGIKNRAQEIQWVCQDFTSWKTKCVFDVVFANLLSGLISQNAKAIGRRLTSGGCLVISGFLREEWKELKRTMELHGFYVKRLMWKNRWGAVWLIRK